MSPHLPLWLPVLLLGLLWLGYRQSRPRSLRPRTAVGIALGMGALSLYGVLGSLGNGDSPGSGAAVLSAWALAYGAAAALGLRAAATHGLCTVAGGTRIHLPGSWWPMVRMLGIFSLKTLLGFATAVHAPLLGTLWFGIAMAAALGALSGGFAAQALALCRVAHQGAAPRGSVMGR